MWNRPRHVPVLRGNKHPFGPVWGFYWSPLQTATLNMCVCMCVSSTFVSSPSLFFCFFGVFCRHQLSNEMCFLLTSGWRASPQVSFHCTSTTRANSSGNLSVLLLCVRGVCRCVCRCVCVCNIRLWHLSWWLYENVPLCLVSWFSKHSYWWTCITGASAV